MLTLLLISTTLLGLLAFFEPCTIATHTLFSRRVHQNKEEQSCCHNLFVVWLSRSVLLVILMALAVIVSEPPEWGTYTPSILLFIIAIIYLLSRFVYLPIPHLEFFKLIPKGKKLPFSVQLGSTLPACTLPLVAIVIGMAVTVGSLPYAIISGLLFATMFTLPMILVSVKGLHSDGLEFLNRASKGSPYLTAVLLFGLALYLLIAVLDINVATFKATLEHASWAGIGIGFLAGFVFSFNPVSFASVPVMLAYVTKAHEERRAVLMGGAFVAGMLVTHVTLGVVAALGGEWVKSVMGREWGLLLGPVLILMGLMWSGLINVRLRWFGVKGHKATGIWGAFLLGIPFSVAVCPFCTPALLVALTASASIGSPVFGFALLLAFALGRSIPVILGAWSMGWLESLQVLSRYQRLFEIIAGVTLALTGLYLLNEYFFIIQY
ncbi:Cytochrome c-type biogenesis protein CcdA (DsbD analog) [hydrothermal vent metagenome]|uniref:Cytochrome c-type biogenesis protein CcdA (DsbD analog) n=1 Tax=hydrothermal vent metagenome TaxID=652676 RepID=A0A3B0ZHY7_9ZZZZ